MILSWSNCSLFLRSFLNGDSRIWIGMRMKIFWSTVENITIFLLFLTTPGLVSGLWVCVWSCCFYVHHTSQSLGSFPRARFHRWEWPWSCVPSGARPWALCSHCWLRPGGPHLEHPPAPKRDKLLVSIQRSSSVTSWSWSLWFQTLESSQNMSPRASSSLPPAPPDHFMVSIHSAFSHLGAFLHGLLHLESPNLNPNLLRPSSFYSDPNPPHSLLNLSSEFIFHPLFSHQLHFVCCYTHSWFFFPKVLCWTFSGIQKSWVNSTVDTHIIAV